MAQGPQAYRAIEKLDDARNQIENMRAAMDGIQFKRAFHACLSDTRSSFYLVNSDTLARLRRLDSNLKQGKRLKDYRAWWSARIKVFDTDPLLKWGQESRDNNIHAGIAPVLSFKTTIGRLSSNNFLVGPPGSELKSTAQGVSWVYGKGTPQQFRSPAQKYPDSRAEWKTTVTVTNPPGAHEGIPLTDVTPAHLCSLIIDYHENLIGEVLTNWPTQ